MSIIKLNCPNCKVPFLPNDINIKSNRAHCKACNTIHDVDKVELHGKDRSYKQNLDPIPEIREINDEHGYTIEFDWRDFSNYKFHLTFGIIIIAFTLPLTIILFLKAEIVGALLVGIFSLLGLWLLNTGLQEYFNKTIIHFEDDMMNIYHQPFTILLQETECSTAQIEQVYVRKVDKGSSNGKQHYSHDLWADINGREHRLFSVFKEEKDAFYVERLIEDYLGIKDVVRSSEHEPGKSAHGKEEQMLKLAEMMNKVAEKRRR